MKQSAKRWTELTRLAALKRDLELNALAAMQFKIADQTSALLSLANSLTDRSRQLNEMEIPDSALLARTDEGWMAWTNAERNRRLMDLARTKSAYEQQLDKARLAFGKAETVKRLGKK